MSLRFRKSIKLAPGIRMNLSGSGLSWTLGPRGFSMNVGGRGTYLNTGIPGTGLYSRTRLDSSASPRRYASPVPSVAAAPKMQVAVNIHVDDEGRVSYTDEGGQAVSDRVINALKRQKGPDLAAILAKHAADINAQVEALGEIHWATPQPTTRPTCAIAPFTEPEPELPSPPKFGILDRILPWRRRALESEYSTALASALRAQDDWVDRKARHAGQQVRLKTFIESDIYKNVGAMETYLGEHLRAISWPRETSVTFEIQRDGEKVILDVDLPEIEQLPKKRLSVPARGYTLTAKTLMPAESLKLYRDHIHGIGFRLIGECFAALPCQRRLNSDPSFKDSSE